MKASAPAGTSAEVESAVSDEKDIATAIVGEHRHAIDPAIKARVVRKIDWFLIPPMSIGYGLVYYGKVSTSPTSPCHADLAGQPRIRRPLRNDHRLYLVQLDTKTSPPTTKTSRLSWATSMFYFGMLANLYPTTFALQRFNMGRNLGIVVCFWALLCMLTAAVTNW